MQVKHCVDETYKSIWPIFLEHMPLIPKFSLFQVDLRAHSAASLTDNHIIIPNHWDGLTEYKTVYGWPCPVRVSRATVAGRIYLQHVWHLKGEVNY